MITFLNIGYMGRLGNQMFQFASTLGIAKELGFDVKFPVENCSEVKMNGPVDERTGKNLAVRCNLLDCFEIDKSYFIPSSAINSNFIYREGDFGYNLETKSLPKYCDLIGYFQTEKYFSKYRDIIISQFRFKEQYRNEALSYIEKIRENNKSRKIASIHVRRGDYKGLPDHHPLCSIEYYQKAISALNNSGDYKFIIFSDDVDWCRDNFIGELYEISELENPYVEMCAMTLCDSNIIANSSFSWWGAWLNENEDKTVIYPSKWFGPLLNKNTNDICPEKWIKI